MSSENMPALEANGRAEVDVAVDDTMVAPPLSSGAGRALCSVLKRLLDTSKDANIGLTGKKRPRGELGLILAGDEDVRMAADEERAEIVKERENRRAKLSFEALGHVVPDAATGAPLEKALRETATRGVLALFNAVAKAQKISSSDSAALENKSNKKEPITREGFMEMIRAGVSKAPRIGSAVNDKDDAETSRGAKWMRDDYMTEGARKLKNWDKEDVANSDSDDDEVADDDDDSVGLREDIDSVSASNDDEESDSD